MSFFKRTLSLLKALAKYRRALSIKRILELKLYDSLDSLMRRATMRKCRSLRLLFNVVPVEKVTVENDRYQFRLEFEGQERSFGLRKDSSDVDVFLQVIEGKSYGEVARLLEGSPGPLRIVDAGANIGLATLYFKTRFPQAEILALEPEPENFASLERCIQSNALQDIRALDIGLWGCDTNLVPASTFRDGEAWSFALTEAAGSQSTQRSIPVMSLGTLMAQQSWSAIDLLKIDIEGAEANLLTSPEFLELIRDKVRLVCMEVHEEVISRQEARRALEEYGMTCVFDGENLIALGAGFAAASRHPHE